MAGNFRASAGVEPAQSRTAVQGSYVPVRQAPVQQVPAGYQLAYQVGGPRYMYGETPFYGARYADGGIVPGQIYGNMRGSREGADMFGFWPTMFQSQPYATASQMYTPGLGVMPLIGYPSKYPHVVMGGYSDYGSGIVNQAMGMMLPLLMMGLYRQMFPPMMPQAPAQAARAGGGGGGGRSGGSGGSRKEWTADKEGYKFHYPGAEADWDGYASPSTRNVPGWGGRVDAVGPFQGTPEQIAAAQAEAAQAAAAAAQSAAAPAAAAVPALAGASATAQAATQLKEAAKPWYRSAIDFFKSSSYDPNVFHAKDAPVQVKQSTKTLGGLYDYY